MLLCTWCCRTRKSLDSEPLSGHYHRDRTQCVSKRRCSSLSYRTWRFGLNVMQRLQSAVAFAQGWCPQRRIRTKNERSANSRN